MSKKTKEKKEAPAVETKELGQETPKAPVSFDVWYFSKKIPKQHAKEIVWADFKSRGAGDHELAEMYDEYLALYGIK